MSDQRGADGGEERELTLPERLDVARARLEVVEQELADTRRMFLSADAELCRCSAVIQLAKQRYGLEIAFLSRGDDFSRVDEETIRELYHGRALDGELIIALRNLAAITPGGAR